MKTGIELIAQERQEQIEKHGLTVQKDIEQNSEGQLLHAADQLILPELTPCHENNDNCPTGWDNGI